MKIYVKNLDLFLILQNNKKRYRFVKYKYIMIINVNILDLFYMVDEQ